MGNLMHAEWLKLTRRPMTWLLLAVFLFFMVLYFTSYFLILGLQDGTFTNGSSFIQLLDEAQSEQLRMELSFPGIFGGVLGQINSIGGICAIILAAGTLGSEYTWGTLRFQLTRYPDRARYLMAKILVLFLVLLVGAVIALLFGSLLAAIYGSILGDVGSVSLRDLLVLPLGIARALYVILPYVLATLAACVIGRSVLAGTAGGLIFLFLDSGTGTLSFLSELGNPIITFLIHLPLQINISSLIILNRSAYGLDSAVITRMSLDNLPSPLYATVVIGCYSALFFAYAYYGLVKRDIEGAG